MLVLLYSYMTADTITQMQKAASERFDNLTAEKVKVEARLDYLESELSMLQGEYRAYDAVLNAYLATPVGDLGTPPEPPKSEATRIEVRDADAEPTAE